MATFNKFQVFVEELAEKVHNLGSDTLKVALTDTAPDATDTTWNLTDAPAPTNTNGYAAGGSQITQGSSAQTTGTYKLVLEDLTFTAAGGTLGPFRYAILYNSTATGNNRLIGWWDYGSSITLASGETFTIDCDTSAGVLTIA